MFRTNLRWVFNAYAIAFGGLLLLGGHPADLFGQRRLFVGGFAVLAFASILEPGEKGEAVTR